MFTWENAAFLWDKDRYTGSVIIGTQWEQLQAPPSGCAGWAYCATKSHRSDGQDTYTHSTGLCLFRFTIMWITKSSCTMIFWLGSLQLYRERNVLKELMKLMTSPQNFSPKPPTLEHTFGFQKVYLFYSVFSSIWYISHIHFLISFLIPMVFISCMVYIMIANNTLTS